MTSFHILKANIQYSILTTIFPNQTRTEFIGFIDFFAIVIFGHAISIDQLSRPSKLTSFVISFHQLGSLSVVIIGQIHGLNILFSQESHNHRKMQPKLLSHLMNEVSQEKLQPYSESVLRLAVFLICALLALFYGNQND